jgi:hypothetical protein
MHIALAIAMLANVPPPDDLRGKAKSGPQPKTGKDRSKQKAARKQRQKTKK